MPIIFSAAKHHIFKELIFFCKNLGMKITDPWLQPNFYGTWCIAI